MKIQPMVILVILASTLALAACTSQTISLNATPELQSNTINGEPINDIPKIAEVLDQLAEKNVSMYEMEGWWHRINTVVSQSGELHSVNHEEWSRLSKDPSGCMEKMDIVKDPDSGETMLWQMMTVEGFMGDLISLRKGESEVIQVDPVLCRFTTDTTEAGYLARNLMGETPGKESRMAAEWAKAWYEEQDGKSVFVVHAGFMTSFEKLNTQTEVYSFDVQSGMAVGHYLSMGYEFDMQMGSVETRSYYELWEELPNDVATQFEQAAKELKSFTKADS